MPVPFRSETTGTLTLQDVDVFAYRFHAGDSVSLDARAQSTGLLALETADA